MADWSIWVWVLIAVIALIIIVAIIFGTKRKDEVDPDGPFAQEQHKNSPPADARRGAAEDTATEAEAPHSEPSPTGRRAQPETDEEAAGADAAAAAPVAEANEAAPDAEAATAVTEDDEDEETLTGPLTVPDDAGTDDAGTSAAGESDAASGADESAAEPAPRHTEDDFAPDEPVVAAPGGMASEEPESHFEPPAAEGAAEVEPDEVADQGRAVEPVPETTPAPAAEGSAPAAEGTAPAAEGTAPAAEGTAQGTTTPVDVGSPDDNDPPETDFTPPRHAAGADYGEPVQEVDADDDVPRDDLGRRLDPYGNPVD